MSPGVTPSEDSIRERIEHRYGQELAKWIRDLAASLRGARGTLPIDAQNIAEAIGVTFRRVDDPAAYGSTRYLGSDTYEVRVSPGLDQLHENFTIAHELAHVVLHRISDGEFVDGDAVERTCDLIATHLLCPLPAVDTVLRHRGLNLRTTSKLAVDLRLPEHQVWLFISQYYPVTFLGGRANRIETSGRFSIEPFSDFIDKLVDCRDGSRSLTIERNSQGVGRWSLEIDVGEGRRLRGILKPFGEGVKRELPVRAVGKARSTALLESADDWVMPSQDRIAVEGALR